MVYLVTTQTELFESNNYKIINAEQSLQLMKDWEIIQFDTETTGIDSHIDKILCIQFGNDKADTQIVVDVTTINIQLYKSLLESKYLIGQNLKFDLQFLYSVNIIPRKVYDTMIVEQLLYLGYPQDMVKIHGISYSLKSIASRRLKINIDKSIREEILWRGLDSKVIEYAASDCKYLEKIRDIQLKECFIKDCLKAAKLENDFVPVIAYLEWCGIKLDTNKWKNKMEKDQQNLNQAEKDLNNFVVSNPKLKQFTYINLQGSLFDGFDSEPKCIINWSSSAQVIPLAKILGFNTQIQDKKTGENKDSVLEKHLKQQKGINDEFLKLYFGKGDPDDEDYYPGYQGSKKVVTSFGQGHLNAINPITGRIHTIYKQLGADTSRMSCGSTQNNDSLSKYKGIAKCTYPNMQQLPHDAITRSCFVSEPNNLWVSCDFSALESRLGADIYQEKAMIEEFLYGSGDMHSLVAKMVFPELKDVPVKEIKKKFPHLRSKAKPIEFSQQFGGSAKAIQNSMGCSYEEAQAFATAYNNGFKGISKFKEKGSKAVLSTGYILLNPITGHKTYWWDWKEWKKRQDSFTPTFWEEYKQHKNTGDEIALMVKKHSQVKSKWERKSLNSVTQGTGTIILKDSQIKLFNWVIDNGFFGKILLCNLTHDEANWEFPKEISNFPNLLKSYMEQSAAIYCKSLPIPAECEVETYWKH